MAYSIFGCHGDPHYLEFAPQLALVTAHTVHDAGNVPEVGAELFLIHIHETFGNMNKHKQNKPFLLLWITEQRPSICIIFRIEDYSSSLLW